MHNKRMNDLHKQLRCEIAAELSNIQITAVVHTKHQTLVLKAYLGNAYIHKLKRVYRHLLDDVQIVGSALSNVPLESSRNVTSKC